ncbi:hypothetical protein B1748_22685 [Paenibacillus sp. MY03]|uniref:VOC family protein n=1 Tax=Paenibacillus sp. MY03 TaxID=302980 RepID=UPI000B3CC6B8|nr:VOC family protein [Paenibacillus sp. MY03]OUS73283.1 hypothetical protein B1748_22685 [Paenibacillus sp. MY03]
METWKKRLKQRKGMADMERSVKLGHAAIYARDIGRLESFYRDVIGMKVLGGERRGEIGKLGFDHANTKGDISIVGHPKDVRMTFYADARACVEHFRQKLVDRGVPASELGESEQGVSFLFSDPEGNRIEMAWLSEQ